MPLLRPTAAAVLLLGAALAAAPAAPAWAAPETHSMQGDTADWRRDPHMHAFYAAVVAACANGADKADVPALEARSREIFGEMAASHHMKPAALQAHLAGIPRQMVDIAKSDPGVLKSYDAFAVAVFGPD